MTKATATVADTTPKKQRGVPFKPGVSPNPAGRPKGARNKLGEDFLQALQKDFTAHGEAAITRVRAERPQDYLKVIASILPKQVEIKTEPFDGVTDEDLAALVDTVSAALGLAREGAEGAVH